MTGRALAQRLADLIATARSTGVRPTGGDLDPILAGADLIPSVGGARAIRLRDGTQITMIDTGEPSPDRETVIIDATLEAP